MRKDPVYEIVDLFQAEDDEILAMRRSAFRIAIAGFERPDALLLQGRLGSMQNRMRTQLDRATRDWQEHGIGLPNWYGARFKYIDSISIKIQDLQGITSESERVIRTRRYARAPKLPPNFEVEIAEMSYEELTTLKRQLDVDRSIRDRGQKLQVIQKYLTAKRHERNTQTREVKVREEERFLKLSRRVLGEDLYFGLVQMSRQVEEVDLTSLALAATRSSQLTAQLLELEDKVAEKQTVLDQMMDLEAQITNLEKEIEVWKELRTGLSQNNPNVVFQASVLRQIRLILDS